MVCAAGIVLMCVLCGRQENASLKKEVLEKGSRMEGQPDCKIGELTEQRHVIPNSILITSF